MVQAFLSLQGCNGFKQITKSAQDYKKTFKEEVKSKSLKIIIHLGILKNLNINKIVKIKN